MQKSRNSYSCYWRKVHSCTYDNIVNQNGGKMDNNDIDSIISILNDASIKMQLPKPELTLPKYLLYQTWDRISNPVKTEPSSHYKVFSGVPNELTSVKQPIIKAKPLLPMRQKTPLDGIVGIQVCCIGTEEDQEETKGESMYFQKGSNSDIFSKYSFSRKPLPRKLTSSTIRYLKFRPYVDPIDIRPYKPPDRGYYYKMHKGDIPLIKYTLEDNGFREAVGLQEWTIMWSVTSMKSQVYQGLKKYQKVNHFPRSNEITRKDSLSKNMTRMQSIHGARHFDFVPKSFVLPQDFPQLSEEMDKNPDCFWIIKPAASSQGRGIFVTDNINDIPSKTALIASQYINDPLLIDGYKFDMRIYLAITSIDPLRLYVYEEGLVRFATCKYSPMVNHNKGNRFMHLTNYSVNKHNANFVANADPSADGVGSKWSLTALKKYFVSLGVKDDFTWSRIEEIMIKTVISIEPIIKASCDMYLPFRGNCFELLGFDILLDSTLTPWLLEVNLSPSLNCDAPLDQKIKGELIADLFTMIGIVPIDQRDYLSGTMRSGAQLNPYVAALGEMKPIKMAKPPKVTKKVTERAKLTSAKPLSKEEKFIIKETDEEFKRYNLLYIQYKTTIGKVNSQEYSQA
eukprot:TRINITY_DN191_c0_g1_i1.p1 TRINITY_DN191_c0_g1~~TRINITY_DN191_c0_g1_i1.p1  ORF type:complete len:624 (-),score=34.24 TRINITY_DN191_c0_g1_i1:6279-8150(-)